MPKGMPGNSAAMLAASAVVQHRGVSSSLHNDFSFPGGTGMHPERRTCEVAPRGFNHRRNKIAGDETWHESAQSSQNFGPTNEL